MVEPCGDFEHAIRSAAEQAIRRCAQGLLTVGMLSKQVREEWKTQSQEEDRPDQKLLNRLALRYCSRTLYLACCSPYPEERNCAFENLHRFLEQALQYSPYASPLLELANASEDVLQQTLADLQKAFTRIPPDGPDDPDRFLKWTQTILIRHAYAIVNGARQRPVLSLEAQPEASLEQLTGGSNQDPQTSLELQELHLTLKNAILSLSNPRYRQVLFGTFLAEIEERELALLMGVEVEKIYLWRHRALEALRSNREVVEALLACLRQ